MDSSWPRSLAPWLQNDIAFILSCKVVTGQVFPPSRSTMSYLSLLYEHFATRGFLQELTPDQHSLHILSIRHGPILERGCSMTALSAQAACRISVSIASSSAAEAQSFT